MFTWKSDNQYFYLCIEYISLTQKTRALNRIKGIQCRFIPQHVLRHCHNGYVEPKDFVSSFSSFFLNSHVRGYLCPLCSYTDVLTMMELPSLLENKNPCFLKVEATLFSVSNLSCLMGFYFVLSLDLFVVFGATLFLNF